MRIGIIGTGHVGLVTGVALASLGHQVVATDVDQEKLRFLSSGKAPFFEPGLDELLGETLATGSLRFALDMAEAVRGSRVVFICVGRPPVGNGDRSVGAVEDAARSVAAAAQDDVVVVVKSTVPPGTTRRVAQVLASERPSLRFDAASSPEFLREGHAIADTLRPDRLVVGACGDLAVSVLRDLYAPIVASGSRWVETDPESAELSKLASNAFLALKVSFANALARVAERSGADVRDVTDIMGGDERIGARLPRRRPWIRWVLSPEDLATLERVASRGGYDFPMLREAERIDEEALEAVIRMVEEAVWNLEGKRIAMLGVAFKAGVDDVRASPALALARRLMDEGAIVTAFDPRASELAATALPGLILAR